jgi:biotin operon repressor
VPQLVVARGVGESGTPGNLQCEDAAVTQDVDHSPRRGKRPSTLVSDVEPLEITDRRQSRLAVHARLRQLILDGTLPPGTILSQVQLSRALGVSRTPLREALRMLQEEGLIDAEPNRRPRIKGFDSSDLESVYSIRILLETFAAELTIPTLGPEDTPFEFTDPDAPSFPQRFYRVKREAP